MVTVSNSSSGENRFSNDHFPSYPVVIVSIEIIPKVFSIIYDRGDKRFNGR